MSTPENNLPVQVVWAGAAWPTGRSRQGLAASSPCPSQASTSSPASLSPPKIQVLTSSKIPPKYCHWVSKFWSFYSGPIRLVVLLYSMLISKELALFHERWTKKQRYFCYPFSHTKFKNFAKSKLFCSCPRDVLEMNFNSKCLPLRINPLLACILR